MAMGDCIDFPMIISWTLVFTFMGILLVFIRFISDAAWGPTTDDGGAFSREVVISVLLIFSLYVPFISKFIDYIFLSKDGSLSELRICYLAIS